MNLYFSSTSKPLRTLTENEHRQLLKVTAERRDGFRDHVLYSMALATGLREHELAGLQVGDVFEADGLPKRRITLRVFKGSDGTHTQEVIVAPELRTKLERLRGWKEWERESLAPDAPLFVSNRGKRLSTRQIRHSFGVWQQRAGFDRHVNFHILRHSACSAIYRKTKDIRLTQRFARHKSVLTTAVYSHPTDEDLVRAVGGVPC